MVCVGGQGCEERKENTHAYTSQNYKLPSQRRNDFDLRCTKTTPTSAAHDHTRHDPASTHLAICWALSPGCPGSFVAPRQPTTSRQAACAGRLVPPPTVPTSIDGMLTDTWCEKTGENGDPKERADVVHTKATSGRKETEQKEERSSKKRWGYQMGCGASRQLLFTLARRARIESRAAKVVRAPSNNQRPIRHGRRLHKPKRHRVKNIQLPCCRCFSHQLFSGGI